MAEQRVTSHFKYWAFISYSHADTQWADWLQHALETYRIPKALIGKESVDGMIPTRLNPVFRDRADLSASHSLDAGIENALAASGHLIVVCSPDSAQSRYVAQEILHFKRLGRANRILALIVDGEPNSDGGASEEYRNCFPLELLQEIGADGELTGAHSEPIAADVRPGKDGRSIAKLKIVAGILDVGFDELRQRDALRRKKRTRQIQLMTLFMLGFVLMVYVGLCDKDINLPASDAVRRQLDRRGVTLFRHVHEDARVQHDASKMRRRLASAIIENRNGDHIHFNGLGEARTDFAECWTSAQSIAALASAAEMDESGFDRIRETVSAVMVHDSARYGDGELRGWGYRNRIQTQGEIAFWLSTGVFALTDREMNVREELWPRAGAFAKQIWGAVLSHQSDDGRSWHSFNGGSSQPNRKREPYATALALQALLAAKKSTLSMPSTQREIDRMIQDACDFLVATFVDNETVSGWQHETPNYSNPIDGLTLQVYATLLEAESTTEFILPKSMFDRATKHLIECAHRQIDYPLETAEITCEYEQGGSAVQVTEAVRFDWYPWAIKAASLWLRRTRNELRPPEDVFRIKRTLSNLVVELGESAVDDRLDTYGWRAAELLYCLSQVPPIPE